MRARTGKEVKMAAGGYHVLIIGSGPETAWRLSARLSSA